MFVKVAHKEERDAIYDLLVEQARPLQIQLGNKKLVTAKVLERVGSSLKLKVPYIEQFRGDQDVTASFSVGDDIYFLKTQVLDKESHYLLQLNPGLHKLQRRGSFRVPIPDNIDAKILLDPVEGQEFKKPLHLSNLSGGGLGVDVLLVYKHLFRKDDLVSFQLDLMGQYRKKIKGRIRQVISSKEDSKKFFRLGIEFEDFKKQDQEELIHLLTGLYRRIFHKPGF